MKSLLVDLQSASLKRIAWAYGVAKKGSETERQLEKALVEKVEQIKAVRARECAADCCDCVAEKAGI
jgi:hypothetical protein